jgi:predicted peptidase
MRRFSLIFMACLFILAICLQIGVCQDYGSLKPSPQIKNYVLTVPEDYKDGDPKLPLLVYLHGGGAFGNYANLQGEANAFGYLQMKYRFILFAPLFTTEEPSMLKALKPMLDEIIEKYPVDTTRIYLTGASAGGRWGWTFAVQNPDLFAAFLPVSGGPLRDAAWDKATLKNIGVLKNLPIRAYHSEQDNIVYLKQVQKIINALKEAGGDPAFIVVPGSGHGFGIKEAYSDETFDWLFQNQKK